MTYETFSRLIGLIEATRGFKFTEGEQQAWFAILQPLGDEEARQGTVEALREVEGRLVPAHIWTRGTRAHQDRKLPLPALESQNITEEQAAENRRKVAEMARSVFKPIT